MGIVSYRLTGSLQTGVVTLRELNGHDELLVSDASSFNAIQLLDNIMLATSKPAASMAVSDRDRLLAALYQYTYGPRVESTLTCTSCNEPYDLVFSVTDLLSFRVGDGKQQRDEEGYFLTEDGKRFRLPTGKMNRLFLARLLSMQEC
ncbi:hypothetical protein [Hymenobacter volaticus]|uniref:Uncharacterized protein n=1 Tax=Hymenobacter volaticus TaxID=2932254 RepID=A0ABY4G1S6_9BACT|nr:hypothetical protein [Hymenobacter volaticus]UOQ64825.1 hypothetical protein MUN86_14770 [Hymenobacter volaticus]